MEALVIEPYYGGSHKYWADGVIRHTKTDIGLLTLPARHWKWRMRASAVTLSTRYRKLSRKPDVIIASDMLDLACFKALAPARDCPVVLYMHENQLTYPSRHHTERDNHFAFTNYTSTLAADEVWFNSQFHLDNYFDALPTFLKAFPDTASFPSVDALRAKCRVVTIGIDVDEIQAEPRQKHPVPLVLWNHRWEHDKGPDEFAEVLMALAPDIQFNVAVLGKHYRDIPESFAALRDKLGSRVVAFGPADRPDYYQWLRRADILPVTSHHDYLGISTLEALAAGVVPILPNRLVYPEHIPPSARDLCLYETEQDLHDKLRVLLGNRPALPKEIGQLVKSKAWPQVGAQYDTHIERLSQTRA